MRVEIFDAIMMSKLTNQTEMNLIVKIFSNTVFIYYICPKIEFILASRESNFFLTSTNYNTGIFYMHVASGVDQLIVKCCTYFL